MDNSTLGLWKAAAAKRRWKGGADSSWLPLFGVTCVVPARRFFQLVLLLKISRTANETRLHCYKLFD